MSKPTQYDVVLGTPHRPPVEPKEIPLIGHNPEEWELITHEAIKRGWYYIKTPDGKTLNSEQTLAVLLMECWQLEHNLFFNTPIGSHLFKEVIAARDTFVSLEEYLDQWFNGDFTLVGYAGCGKTASFQAFLHRIKQHDPDLRITITAPTNKALKVIQSFGKSSRLSSDIKYQTIYQALGLKVEPDENGIDRVVGEEDGQADILNFDLAGLDEGSMLNSANYNRINGLYNRPRMINLGDSKQLRPVGDKEISPVFRNVLATYTLTEVMRYPKGSAIARLVEAVRDNVGSSSWIDPSEYANGQDVIVTDNEDFLCRLIEDLKSDKYRDNPDTVKVICWQNSVVDWINAYCHEKLYGFRSDSFVPGERLVATKAVKRKIIGGYGYEQILKTRFEADVLTAQVDERRWDNSYSIEYVLESLPEQFALKQKGKISNHQKQDIIQTLTEAAKPFKYWQVTAMVVDEDRRVSLNIADPIEKGRVKKTIDTLRNIALMSPERTIERKRAFYQMYCFRDLFDPVVQSYAGTCHSAQGSSYNHVYCTERDLMRCKDHLERSQLKYVAYSRAMEKLIISM